ncbi:hypothetical protein Tco_1367625 [Tanacetum coccineum]
MSNHEQPTPSYPKSDVRNTHYEKLLPIMADKYEYERRKKEKLEEVKVRLDFGEARRKSTKAQESAYSESRTMSPRRQRRSRSPRHSPSVFTRLRRERSRSPRHDHKSKARRESTVFKRLGSKGRSASAHSDSRQESSRYMENHSESEDSEGGHWKSKSRRQKSSVEDDDLSQPWDFKKGGGFRSQHKQEKRSDRFTLLRKTPTEILALEKAKFKTPPPMTTPVEKRNANKVCEFHGKVGHNTNECNHLRRQTEDMLKAGKLSHIIKELKQINVKDQKRKGETSEKEKTSSDSNDPDMEKDREAKDILKLSHIIKELKQNSAKDQKRKGKTFEKEKPQAILMIQSWQKISQSFSLNLEISFPSLGDNEESEGPLIIEAEIGGHQVHRICVDGGSSFEILYEHYFNRLHPEIRNQMILATTSLIGSSGEIK